MRRIAAVAVAGVVLVALVAAQLALPAIAAQRLRERLAKSGTVLDVEVSAFPAIELLWHHADRVVVRMAGFRSSAGGLGALLSQAAGVGTLDASVTELETGLLTLRDATLRKRGAVLSGSARVTESDLQSAVPFLQSVSPVASGAGTLTLRGTASLFGLTASLDATVAAVNGAVVVEPDLPLGGLATMTAFSDPHVDVEAVGAQAEPGGFILSGRARLR